MLALAGLLATLPAGLVGQAPANEYLALRSAIGSLTPDGGAVADVQSLVLERPAARLALGPGRLALLRLQDRIIGAVYTGRGRFAFRAGHPVERDQLRRAFQSDSLDLAVKSVVLLFGDGTAAELEGQLTFAASGVPNGAENAVRDAVRYLEAEDDDLGFDIGVMRTFLNGDSTALFHAHMELEDGDPVYYRYDASLGESVSLGRKARRGRVYDLVASFDVERERDPTWVDRDRPAAEVLHYDVDVVIEDNLDFQAVTRPFVIVNGAGEQWIPFRLFRELKVDSVRWAGVRTQHVRDDDAYQLWVRTPGAVEAGSGHDVEFFYGGDLIRRVEGWVFIRSMTGWYPVAGEVDATFDLEFTYPARYSFAGTGVETERRQEGDVVYAHWEVTKPSPHASFNLGEFTETPFDDGRVPAVRLQVAERAHKRLEGLLLQQDIAQQVGSDIVNSLAFFTEAYGPAPVESLLVTEIPYSHGQAFPEMLQLSWVTFQWTGSKGHDEIFRAHEVAHLWWGLSARPRTYRDTWLSEGLAEFSGLWYMQRVLMNNELYFDRLDDAKRRILERRGKSGPIGLGPRVFSSRTEEDYQIVVYEKGAWVIQMLRNLMLDLDTMDESIFKGVMQDLYQLGQRGPIGTEDLKRLSEQHLGVDMTWFFDQWVYGNEIPTWRFSWTGEETAEGYQIHARILQEDVPDDFQMIVPVRVGFGDEGWARFRVLVKGPVTEVDFPLLPRRPDEVVFNELASVLAEVKEERWR